VKWVDVNEYFTGYLDDIMVYDRALSASEILDLYQHPLPVELTYFSSTVNRNNVTLRWCTEQEINNKGFEILRSADKVNWKTAGFINGGGTTNEPKNYSFTDTNLKQVLMNINSNKLITMDISNTLSLRMLLW
jgi:hypothetical protein